MKLDEKGRKLIAKLATDGRATASALAKHVRLSREAVGYRIAKLQEHGCIVGCAPVIDIQKLGYFRAHIYLLLDEQHQPKHKGLIEWITAHPNTSSVLEYSDTWDIGWSFAVKDLHEFDAINTELSTRFPDEILERRSLLVVRSYMTSSLPRSFGVVEQLPTKGTDHHTPDGKDIAILHHLSGDARQGSYAIGAAAGLSGDATLARIRRLQEANIIRGFATFYNLATFGYQWYTYAMRVDHLDKENEARLRDFLTHHRAVIRAEKTIGNWDLVLTIVAEDQAQYHAIVKEIKNVFAAIITHYESWIVYKEHCYTVMPEAIGE